MNLYNISQEYLRLLDSEEEINEEELKICEENLQEKFQNYQFVILELQGDVDKVKKEIERLKAKKDKLDNRVKTLKETLLTTMQTLNLNNVKTENFKFKVSNAGGKQSLELCGDVPEEFKKVVYETDNEKIREALNNGEYLEFAKLAERKKILKVE